MAQPFFWYARWRNNLFLRRHCVERLISLVSSRGQWQKQHLGVFLGHFYDVIENLLATWLLAMYHPNSFVWVLSKLLQTSGQKNKNKGKIYSKENLAPRTQLQVFFKKGRDIINKVNTLKRIKCIFRLILYITLNSDTPFPFCSSLHIHCQCLCLVPKWVLESHKLRWHLCSISY